MENGIITFNNDCLEVMRSQTFYDMTKGKRVIIVTDPPFNIGYHYKSYKDNMEDEAYYEWLEEIIKDYPCAIIHYPEALYKLSFQIGRFPNKVVSWVYNSNTAKQHRDIAFFDINPNFNQVRQPYKNPKDKRIIERMKNGSGGGRLYDWWNVNQVKNVSKAKTIHPCQMPLQVMENIIGILPTDCTIVDPFMGSGTTGEAVINMNQKQNAQREFIGIEIDDDYYQVALNRFVENQRRENGKSYTG